MNVLRPQPPDHPPPRAGAEHCVVRQDDVSEKVHTLRQRAEDHFLGVDIQTPPLPQPPPDRQEKTLKLSALMSEEEKIVSIAEVEADTEPFLDIVVKCIEVRIREQLRSYAAERKSCQTCS